MAKQCYINFEDSENKCQKERWVSHLVWKALTIEIIHEFGKRM
jgi:hypothetical protein